MVLFGIYIFLLFTVLTLAESDYVWALYHGNRKPTCVPAIMVWLSGWAAQESTLWDKGTSLFSTGWFSSRPPVSSLISGNQMRKQLWIACNQMSLIKIICPGSREKMIGEQPENKMVKKEQLTCPHGMRRSYLDENPVDKFHHMRKIQLHKSGK